MRHIVGRQPLLVEPIAQAGEVRGEVPIGDRLQWLCSETKHLDLREMARMLQRSRKHQHQRGFEPLDVVAEHPCVSTSQWRTEYSQPLAHLMV